ncbi:MAG: methyltransferase domain-containing protein [Chitinophagaceae bacterium]|nr:methyltransferase domain-containing protein [Oligoflexus sp.]
MSLNTQKVATDLAHVLRVAASYRATAIFRAAIELEVFSYLERRGESGMHVEEIAESLHISLRSAEKLLGGLCAIELLEKSSLNQTYRNTPSVRRFLVKKSPQYLGEGLLMLEKIGQKTWGTLTETVRQGSPLAEQRTDKDQAEFWKILTQAIAPLSEDVAQSLWRLLKSKSFPVDRILDLAGGSGVFGHACLKFFPDAHVDQVDWPHVNEVAKKRAFEMGHSARFNTISGTIFSDVWDNEYYDVVILSHILHQESVESIECLLKRVAKVLRPGGKVVINEYCLNNEKSGPYYGLIFAVNMLLQNHGGDSYSLTEYATMLHNAGLPVETMYSPVPPSTLLIGAAPQIETSISLREFRVHSPVKVATTVEMPPNFADRRWDSMGSDELDHCLLKLLQQQLRFASEYVYFWHDRLPPSLLQAKPLTRKIFEQLPLLDKKTMRLLEHGALLPKNSGPFHVVRSTGGTTGTPVSIAWKLADWHASLETVKRFLDPIAALKPNVIWNGYNQGHVSGPIFDDAIRQLGATPFARHFRSTDAEALDEIRRTKATVLVITPKGGSGKGGSLEDFLSIDPDFIRKFGIRGLIISSTVLEADLAAELKEQGIEVIVNFYGSTEALPDAVSCDIDPSSFHLCQGHVFVEVIDSKGCQVRNGERGLVAVSRIGSSGPAGIAPTLGTQLFRYVVGDMATYSEEPCGCGRTTPRISEIARVLDIEEKLQGGCQKWE